MTRSWPSHHFTAVGHLFLLEMLPRLSFWDTALCSSFHHRPLVVSSLRWLLLLSGGLESQGSYWTPTLTLPEWSIHSHSIKFHRCVHGSWIYIPNVKLSSKDSICPQQHHLSTFLSWLISRVFSHAVIVQLFPSSAPPPVYKPLRAGRLGLPSSVSTVHY